MTYQVQDAVNLIRDKTNTINQIMGKGVNQLFTDTQVLRTLQLALDRFAKDTKCIEDWYTVAVDNQTQFIATPPLVLRSAGYRYMNYYQNQILFPIDIQGMNNTFNHFALNNYTGIPSFAMIWGTTSQQQIGLYPRPNQAAATTTLAADYKAGDATITLTSVQGFLNFNGRITIGTTKILYKQANTSTNTLTGCAVTESTTDVNYSSGTTVSANNIWIYHVRTHFLIPNTGWEVMPNSVGDLYLEIPNEYLNGICDETAYQLIKKIDVKRAESYKFDFDAFIQMAQGEISAGRSEIKKTSRIRGARPWESDILENQMY